MLICWCFCTSGIEKKVMNFQFLGGMVLEMQHKMFRLQDIGTKNPKILKMAHKNLPKIQI